MTEMPLRDVNLGEYRLVLPIGEVDGLLTWLSREDVVTLSAAGNRICLRGEEREFTVSAVDDRFPAYRLLIEGQQPACGRATVGRDALLSAIRDDAPRSATSSDVSTAIASYGDPVHAMTVVAGLNALAAVLLLLSRPRGRAA